MGQSLIFAGAKAQSEQSYNNQHEHLVHIPWYDGTTAPAMMLKPTAKTNDRPGLRDCVCVIYFHAISCDIGRCFEDLTSIRDVAFDGNAVIIAPEFPGYGLLREHRPTVVGINHVAEAAFDFCWRGLGFARDRIIFWGRSIGTGPAAALARACVDPGHRLRCHDRPISSGCCGPTVAEPKIPAPRKNNNGITRPFAQDGVDAFADGTRPLGGLVLVAPLTSVEDVVFTMTQSTALSKLVGPMWEVAEMVKCPGLRSVPLSVMHAFDDKVVPFSQGESVLSGAVMRPKLGIWLQGGGHNFSLSQDCFQISTCGEPRAIGFWLSMGTFNGRHVYRLKRDSQGVVYWNSEYAEWRLYFKDIRETSTLFHSTVNAVTVPTKGWQANDGSSERPVVQKIDPPLCLFREFMAEHASHGGPRVGGRGWEWTVPGEHVFAKPLTVKESLFASHTGIAGIAASPSTEKKHASSMLSSATEGYHNVSTCFAKCPQDVSR